MKLLGVITRAGLATGNFPINCYLIIYGSFDVSWQLDKEINKSIVHLWYSLSPYHQLLDLATFIFTLGKFIVVQRVSAGLAMVHQLQSRKDFTPELDETHALQQHSSEAQSEFFCLTCAEWKHKNIFGKNLPTLTVFVPWASPPVLCRCVSSPQTMPCSFLHFFLGLPTR